MPKQREFASMEERFAYAAEHVSPALVEQSKEFNERRKKGLGRRYDLVPHFVEAYKSLREASRSGEPEARGEARFNMGNVEKSARQQLSAADFKRFKEGIK